MSACSFLDSIDGVVQDTPGDNHARSSVPSESASSLADSVSPVQNARAATPLRNLAAKPCPGCERAMVDLHDMLANTLDREALKHVDQSAISATSNASDLINALLNVDNFNVDCVTAVTRLLKEACTDTKRSVELPVDKMCC